MRNLILPFLLLLTFVFSCTTNDEDDTLEKNVPSHDVYIAGRENNKACFWKNTIKTELSNGDNIHTIQIKVDNNDVYITGSLMANTAFNGIEYFWKNNVRTVVKQYLNIPNNVQYNIESFTVNSGDIYFAGYVENPIPASTLEKFELCFWKNGIKTVLHKSQYISRIKDIIIDGSDVYVSVQKVDNNQINNIGYFKNTVFSSVQAEYITNFAKNNNGLHLLIYKNQFYYSLNINSNIETVIGNYPSPIIFGKLMSDKVTNELYTTYSATNQYHKNSTLITTSFSSLPYIRDMYILNNNIYMIKYNDNLNPNPSNPNLIYNAKVFINGVESQDITSVNNSGSSFFVSGSFNSIYVVEN